MEEAIRERKRGTGIGSTQLRRRGAYCYLIFIAKCVCVHVRGSF